MRVGTAEGSAGGSAGCAADGSAVAKGLLSAVRCSSASAWDGGLARGGTGGTTGGGAVRKVVGIAILVFEQDGTDVVDGDVDGVSDTRDRKDTFGGLGEHGFAGGETGTGGFLDLLDLRALLADNGSHARVGDDEADSDRFAARHGGLVERLIVDSADDETKSLEGRAKVHRLREN